jgi:HD-like signal output (HDOD) protein
MTQLHTTQRAEPPQVQNESYWSLRALPPFPAVATRLLSLLNEDSFDMEKLVELIRADPMFAAELLHTVNSAKYGRIQEVGSIRHAVTMLGRDILKSFAVAVSLRMYLGQVLRQEDLARVWRHSLATAVIGEILANAPDAPCALKSSPGDDSAYVAGLLHNVGCLGLMVAHPKEYTATLAAAGRDRRELREVETGNFGIDHCQAGHWIASAWKFSSAIGDVAAAHHEPLTGDEATLLELVKSALWIADRLGYQVLAGSDPAPIGQVYENLPGVERWGKLPSAEELQAAVDLRIRGFLGARQ